MISKEEIADYFKTLQDDICTAIEAEDRKGKFIEDLWDRSEGGGGRTRILENGDVLEKGGINFSAVHGQLPPNIKAALNLKGVDFFATGVSIVLHPNSPLVPIIHMNVRYFEIEGETWWFGGGIDLTPHYVVDEDARFFHTQLKNACDKHGAELYSEYKKLADNYFYIDHRKETRGVGGIFFDKLDDSSGITKAEHLAFVKTIGQTFAPTYTALMNKNKSLPYTAQEKEWQLIRRGRYVEFNLVYDKGTKFGLQTDGRIESILMSLPTQVNWIYNHQPIAGSKEEYTQKMLKKSIDWV